MISDKDLLKMLMKKYPDGDVDFVMKEFSAYKAKLAELRKH